MTVVHVPASISVSRINDLLEVTAFVFDEVGAELPDVHLDLHRVRNTSILGQLVIFKFVSYSSEHRCFRDPQMHGNNAVIKDFEQFGFWRLLQSYMRASTETRQVVKAYKELKYLSESTFYFAPQRLLRKEASGRSKLEEKFITRVTGFYRDTKAIHIISTCLGEILMNFWEHATTDSGTVLVARGDYSFIEIAIADTGQGIVSNLSANGSHKSPDKALLSAVQMGVTSKADSFHMGYGLWLVTELAVANNGTLHIFSEGGWLRVLKGKLSYSLSPYWKGTILYLRMDLREPKSLKDIWPSTKSEVGSRIDWGSG